MKLRLLPFFFMALAPVSAEDFAPLFLDGSAWEKTQQAWIADSLNGSRFRPVDATHIRLRATGTHTFGELKPDEMLIGWKEDGSGLESMQIVLFNKGDDSPLEKKEFAAEVKKATAALDEALGTKGKPKQVNKKDTGVKVKAVEWVWEKGAARLESCDQEFIRLTLAPDAKSLGGGGADAAVRKSSLRRNVKTEGGAAWIDGIPMVDQGDKGYCVPATLARVFAYYGMDGIDMHAMAALCESGGTTGTTTREMQKALEDISHRFHVRLTQIDGAHKDLEEIYSAYNREAEKVGRPSLPVMEVGRNLGEADPAILGKALGVKTSDMNKWLKPVKKNIDEGIPLLWLVPGHMRLIIGYDTDKKLIFYSDSWGADSVRSAMPLQVAYILSMYRYILKPSR